MWKIKHEKVSVNTLLINQTFCNSNRKHYKQYLNICTYFYFTVFDEVSTSRSGAEIKTGKYWMCPICDKKAQSKTFACVSCRQWCHWKCSNLSKEEVTMADKSTLVCVLCENTKEVLLNVYFYIFFLVYETYNIL